MAAATMALLLFVYTRTSIKAAKANAKLHREADGGQISWRNQSLRQHGQMELPKEPIPDQGKVVRFLDKVTTARRDPKGDGVDARGIGGEEMKIREKVAEMKGR